MNITTKTGRDRLSVRREPYWHKLAKGRFLGFRAGPGTWIARMATPKGERKDEFRSLQELPAGADFSTAKIAAETWFDQMSGGAHRKAKRGTVRAALDAYIADLQKHNRTSTAHEATQRWKQIVDGDPIADVSLDRATVEDFQEWRDRLLKGREPRSVNRLVRGLKAGLNKAVRDLGFTGNPAAWNLRALVDDKEDSGDAAVFLTPEQRQRLIDYATPALANLLRGYEHTGARPGELPEASVADFDVKAGAVTLRTRKGRGSKLRVRSVPLSSEGAKFFSSMVKGKSPKSPLIANPHGEPWTLIQWSRAIRAAINDANAEAGEGEEIPVTASAYSFRHARISELLQVYGIDSMSVCKICGTSQAMIQKYYFKFVPSELKAKLEKPRTSGNRD